MFFFVPVQIILKPTSIRHVTTNIILSKKFRLETADRYKKIKVKNLKSYPLNQMYIQVLPNYPINTNNMSITNKHENMITSIVVLYCAL